MKAFNLSNIPSKYYKFANIFNKSKSEVLTSYHLYNLRINLEEDTQPLGGIIYFLSVSKQETLKEFIEKNLNIYFIQPISFLYSVLVLFVKKKDEPLYLCVDFHSLNYITKKDCYSFPLISGLLNSLCKAWVYIKINFAIYTIWSILPMGTNRRLLSELVMNHLSSL